MPIEDFNTHGVRTKMKWGWFRGRRRHKDSPAPSSPSAIDPNPVYPSSPFSLSPPLSPSKGANNLPEKKLIMMSAAAVGRSSRHQFEVSIPPTYQQHHQRQSLPTVIQPRVIGRNSDENRQYWNQQSYQEYQRQSWENELTLSPPYGTSQIRESPSRPPDTDRLELPDSLRISKPRGRPVSCPPPIQLKSPSDYKSYRESLTPRKSSLGTGENAGKYVAWQPGGTAPLSPQSAQFMPTSPGSEGTSKSSPNPYHYSQPSPAPTQSSFSAEEKYMAWNPSVSLHTPTSAPAALRANFECSISPLNRAKPPPIPERVDSDLSIYSTNTTDGDGDDDGMVALIQAEIDVIEETLQLASLSRGENPAIGGTETVIERAKSPLLYDRPCASEYGQLRLSFEEEREDDVPPPLMMSGLVRRMLTYEETTKHEDEEYGKFDLSDSDHTHLKQEQEDGVWSENDDVEVYGYGVVRGGTIVTKRTSTIKSRRGGAGTIS